MIVLKISKSLFLAVGSHSLTDSSIFRVCIALKQLFLHLTDQTKNPGCITVVRYIPITYSKHVGLLTGNKLKNKNPDEQIAPQEVLTLSKGSIAKQGW